MSGESQSTSASAASPLLFTTHCESFVPPPPSSYACEEPAALVSTVETNLPLVNRFSQLSSVLDILSPEKSSPLTFPTLPITAGNPEEVPESPLSLPPYTTHAKVNTNGPYLSGLVKHTWKTKLRILQKMR